VYRQSLSGPLKRAVIHFASKAALNIDGLREERVEQLGQQEMVENRAGCLDVSINTLGEPDQVGSHAGVSQKRDSKSHGRSPLSGLRLAVIFLYASRETAS
jgi:NAD-dependent DNA ligase